MHKEKPPTGSSKKIIVPRWYYVLLTGKSIFEVQFFIEGSLLKIPDCEYLRNIIGNLEC